jgi:hypothetical protein
VDFSILDLGRERLAHMEEVFPGDAGDESTGAGLEVNCVAFSIGRFLERDPQKHLSRGNGGRASGVGKGRVGEPASPAILD